MTVQRQRWQEFGEVGTAEQGVAETAEDVHREIVEDAQQVVALEQAIHRRQRGIFQARRQDYVVGIPEQTRGQHQTHFIAGKFRSLLFDTRRIQVIVVTEKLEVLALRLFETRLEVADQANVRGLRT